MLFVCEHALKSFVLRVASVRIDRLWILFSRLLDHTQKFFVG